MGLTYDPNTKRLKVSEDKPKASATKTVFVPIGNETLDKLLSFAKEDKVNLKATTDAGKKRAVGQAVRAYVNAAVQEFISARQAM